VKTTLFHHLPKALAVFACVAAAMVAGAQYDPSPAPAAPPSMQVPLTQQMGIKQRLGEYVPKDVSFKDENGKSVKFGELFQGRPIVLLPIFYRCQTSCSALTDSLMTVLAKAGKHDEMKVGRDLDVVMVSIHPKETPELARVRKGYILQDLDQPGTENGWHLLTGDLASVHKITDAIGFKYSYNAEKDLINHPVCSVVLSPEGRISAYTIGNDMQTRILQQDVALAAKNEVADPADQSMMFGCIMVDPTTHKYTLVIERIVFIACCITLVVVASMIVYMSRKYKRTPLTKGGPLGA